MQPERPVVRGLRKHPFPALALMLEPGNCILKDDSATMAKAKNSLQSVLGRQGSGLGFAGELLVGIQQIDSAGFKQLIAILAEGFPGLACFVDSFFSHAGEDSSELGS